MEASCSLALRVQPRPSCPPLTRRMLEVERPAATREATGAIDLVVTETDSPLG
jgi:hypothetical protein